MLLTDKVAVIYGAGGAIGGAVARASAREGAHVHVTGRTAEPVERLAREIGGTAAPVDALDEAAIEAHLDGVGAVDVAFDATGVPCSAILGTPLVDLEPARFARPIAESTMCYFLTARAAARRMVPRGGGVIMTVSALPGRMGTARNGGYGPAQAAKEAMTRDLSLELAPSGVRVVGLRPHGIPGSRTMHDVFALRSAQTGVTWEGFTEYLASTTHARRIMTLDEVAATAAFLASDRASGFTGTTVNLTLGATAD